MGRKVPPRFARCDLRRFSPEFSLQHSFADARAGKLEAKTRTRPQGPERVACYSRARRTALCFDARLRQKKRRVVLSGVDVRFPTSTPKQQAVLRQTSLVAFVPVEDNAVRGFWPGINPF